ncbi:Phospholipase A2, membrane associated [Galemys pyrenaicus]|uniref:Phospholipase A2 n=1 Tax=Galemys pyrenaicus TaxID=202257 RepID=A0A8J5ZTX0_GALPY|nr:Phospholipase A2, membrane associated [Galemys pyrenaicus]
MRSHVLGPGPCMVLALTTVPLNPPVTLAVGTGKGSRLPRAAWWGSVSQYQAPANVDSEPSMRTLLLLAMLMALGLQQADGALWNFWKMVTRATGKEGASSYGFYGCHCGWGGRGSPKDATDRCCVVHDCCYARLIRAGCGTKLLNYEADYRGTTITCGKERPPAPSSPLACYWVSEALALCGDRSRFRGARVAALQAQVEGERRTGKTQRGIHQEPQRINKPSPGAYFPVIPARQNHCKKQLCECDRIAALCFARNKRGYNKKYQYYNNKSCTGRTPKC